MYDSAGLATLEKDAISEKKCSGRVEELEKISHEPQNYKKKCDEMEKRIEAIEEKISLS